MLNTPRPVLIIDDDILLAELLSAILEGAGYSTVLASSGAEGLCQALKVLPAVVFCDMRMPGLSGEEVLREWRADAATAATPFVLMSGDNPDSQSTKADAFLPKPFSSEAVLELARSLALPQTTSLAA